MFIYRKVALAQTLPLCYAGVGAMLRRQLIQMGEDVMQRGQGMQGTGHQVGRFFSQPLSLPQFWLQSVSVRYISTSANHWRAVDFSQFLPHSQSLILIFHCPADVSLGAALWPCGP